MCVCVYLGICAHECKCSWSPEEGVRFLRERVESVLRLMAWGWELNKVLLKQYLVLLTTTTFPIPI